MKYTILMPCLNEEKTIKECINEAKKYIYENNLDAEILIADNKSQDKSKEIALNCGARVVDVLEKGYGAALIEGINSANGEFIIMGDCDFSYDFTSLTPFIKKLEEGYSLVVGNRFKGGIQKGAMPLLHKIGVPFLSYLARAKFKAPVGDFHCGLRAFEKERAKSFNLKCKGMEFATEIIAEFAKHNEKICEVPTPLRCDKRGAKSHLRTFRDGFRHLVYIIKK